MIYVLLLNDSIWGYYKYSIYILELFIWYHTYNKPLLKVDFFDGIKFAFDFIQYTFVIVSQN